MNRGDTEYVFEATATPRGQVVDSRRRLRGAARPVSIRALGQLSCPSDLEQVVLPQLVEVGRREVVAVRPAPVLLQFGADVERVARRA